MSKYIVKAILPMVLTLFILSNVINVSVFAAESTTLGEPKINAADIKADKVITKSGTGYVTSPASADFSINQIQQATLQSTTGSAIAKNSSSKKEVVFLLDTSGALSYVDKQSSKSIFNYSVFAGSSTEPFKLENKTLNIYGDVHSNAYIYDTSHRLSVHTGICESVGVHNIANVDSYDWGKRTENEAFKDHADTKQMPQLSDIMDETKSDYKMVEIKSLQPKVDMSKIQFTIGNVPCMQNSGDIMLKQSEFPSWYEYHSGSIDPDFPAEGFKDTYLSYTTKLETEPKIDRKDIGGAFVIQGPETSQLKIGDKQTYYFDSNVIIRNGALKFEGSGRLIAKGDIIIEGRGLETKTNTTSLIYSQGGSVKIYSSNSPTFNGVIYAPTGDVYIGSNNVTINGSVAANKVFIAAENTTISYASSLNPGQENIDKYKLSYLDLAKETIRNFKRYIQDNVPVGSSVRIGIIQYNESANTDNNNSYILYDTSTADGAKNMEERLDSIQDDDSKKPSNLGDGLRRAYELLKSGDSDAGKYVVVISGALPNAWTIFPQTMGNAKRIGCYYKDGEPASVLTGTAVSVSAIYSDVNKGNSYAMEQVEKINSLNKVPNTSFVAVCKAPNRKDYPGITDKGWQQISDSCSNLKTLLPAAFNSINNNKNVIVTGSDLESAANSIIESIPSRISNIRVEQASITLDLPSGRYFKPAAMQGIKLDESEGINLVDCIDGEDAKNTFINKVITGSSIVLKPGENEGEIIFTTPKLYVPLKYIEIASDPTKSETKEPLSLTGSIKFNLVYDVELPTGKKTMITPVNIPCTPRSFVIKDAIDIN